jgi:hypothetical protein
MSEREVTFADIERAASSRDPQLVELVVRYMELPDPPEDRPEGGDEEDKVALDQDAWTIARLRQSLSSWALHGKDAAQTWAIRSDAWDKLLSATHAPPRLRLAALLEQLYDAGDEPARRALVEIFKQARIGWGLWKAFKSIYKRAEDRHDAVIWGALAWRLDTLETTPWSMAEVGKGTIIYMRRRAWRYLRLLGQAVPEIYTQFAVEVLRHVPADARLQTSWVANQIWAHRLMIGAGRSTYLPEPPKEISERAFDEAWKSSPDPMLRLLEDSPNGTICGWAIRCLQADFPHVLREVDPAWLARLGRKRGREVHAFIVELLSDSPEFHQSKLAGLGLHDMVLSLLDSESDKARSYAIDYANAHAPVIEVMRLAALATSGWTETQAFAIARLEKLEPKQIGLAALIALLDDWRTKALAKKKLEEGFGPSDIDAEAYIQLFAGGWEQRQFVTSVYAKAKQKVPAAHLQALLRDSRLAHWDRHQVLAALGELSARDIGIEWIKQALLDPALREAVSGWLRAGKLAGDDLDIEWVKGLVMRPALRQTAIAVLGNTKLVAPARMGLPWLLAMARQTDPQLQQFAQQHLLMHFAPDDFATQTVVGLDRLFSLVGGAKEPETIRELGSLYLRLHHPSIGPTLPEARTLGVEPRLAREAFTQQRLEPLLLDSRADVRRFAQAIGRVELARWDDPALLYRLARSRHREARALAAEVLLQIGDPEADPEVTRSLQPERWLDAAQVFALAESEVKSTREVALTLIRRHYERLGGARKLAWLMESPDRDVRLFAVRLLWEKHRPRAELVRAKEQVADVDAFETNEALRQFLRNVMFGLPPGRMERRDSGAQALPDRALPASEAKRRLVEIVRDFALEDGDFAQLALPVLEEFMYSEAKGEWHACVAALARIRRAQPDIETALPPARPYPSPPARTVGRVREEGVS